MLAAAPAAIETSAARGRQRRLRQFLRHERLTVAMLLAERAPHRPRGQRLARSGKWVRGEAHSQVPQEPGTQHFFLDDDSVLELGGARPDRLADVRPQEQVQRHIVHQIVDAASPTLDVPVPLREDQLMAVLKSYDFPFLEQVIAVTKISSPSRSSRTVLSEPQTAEELVEAPTLLSLVDVIEHTVDIPVGAGGFSGNGGL